MLYNQLNKSNLLALRDINLVVCAPVVMPGLYTVHDIYELHEELLISVELSLLYEKCKSETLRFYFLQDFSYIETVMATYYGKSTDWILIEWEALNNDRQWYQHIFLHISGCLLRNSYFFKLLLCSSKLQNSKFEKLKLFFKQDLLPSAYWNSGFYFVIITQMHFIRFCCMVSVLHSSGDIESNPWV